MYQHILLGGVLFFCPPPHRVRDIVDKFKKNTRLQLKCFKVVPESASATDAPESESAIQE